MTDLSAFASNVHSQGGEDGMLAELYRRLGVTAGFFVEFGAWDGMHLSNSYALIEAGWSGCYIEGDPDRFRTLCDNLPQTTVRKVQRYVAAEGPDSLDNILAEAGAPLHFELLSIDIDGDDLAVWRGLARHRPVCVVIEYNPTIPFDCLFENRPGHNWGNSAKSIDSFAQQVGYALVAATSTNLIYVDARGALQDGDLDVISLTDVAAGPRYFWGYDGSLLISPGSSDAINKELDPAPELFVVPWANTIAVQPVPKPLRSYHDRDSRFTRGRSALAAATAAVTRPASAATELRKRLRSRRG